MDDVTQLTTDDGVVRVIAGDGVAEVAALLVAVEIFAAEEPAPRPLVDIATQGAEVADQGRSNGFCRLRQQRNRFLYVGGVDDVGQRRRGAEGDPAPGCLDAAQLRNGGDVHQRRR